MGFHILNPQENGSFTSLYVETLEELALKDGISAKAMIYQGDKNQVASQLGAVQENLKYIADWYCAGVRAEKLFRDLAFENKLIVEEISQDQQSFKPYTAFTPNSIKRGDFLIRNARNIEVEVKCRSLNVRTEGTKENQFYKIAYSEVKKLDEMQQITGIPILIAFFQRLGRNPVSSSMKMIAVSRIAQSSKSRIVWYDETSKDFCVPLSLMQDGFSLIERVREAIVQENRVGGTWDALLSSSREASAREILLLAQLELCKSQGMPLFMPEDGICFRCNEDILPRLGVKVTTDIVTGCPICARTYCD